MEGYDSAWPMLRPLPYNVKIGADNPDNLYMCVACGVAWCMSEGTSVQHTVTAPAASRLQHPGWVPVVRD